MHRKYCHFSYLRSPETFTSLLIYVFPFVMRWTGEDPSAYICIKPHLLDWKQCLMDLFIRIQHHSSHFEKVFITKLCVCLFNIFFIQKYHARKRRYKIREYFMSWRTPLISLTLSEYLKRLRNPWTLQRKSKSKSTWIYHKMYTWSTFCH